MTEHPDALLAEYADGELGATDRRAVDEHLAGCERCREELRLAAEARTALRGLPQLEEPPGIPFAVRREARRAPRRSWRGVGAVAVAAGVIAAAVIGVSNLDSVDQRGAESGGSGAGGGGQQPSAPATNEPEAAGGLEVQDSAGEDLARSAAPAPLFTETDRRYDRAALPSLGRRFRERARTALDAGFAPTTTAYFDKFDIGELAPPARQAYRCVLAEVPPEQLVVPLVIEGARFEGSPAYVAAFLQGPAPDQPYDRILIWVVDQESCSLLSLASQRL